MTIHRIAATVAALVAGTAAAHAATVPHFLYSDQSTDQVILTRDLNGDGDANDPGETQVFLDANNASGLTTPTGSVFTMTQGRDGAVYIGDGPTDTVYRLRDNNGNNTAQDAGEASVWFSADNAGGLSLHTPNGVATGPDGAVYIVEADTRGNPDGDFVYRTQDLNGDGDANDAGEAVKWLDLQALNANSSAFEIRFDGDTAYIADTVGGDPNVIYRARDTNGDGSVTPDEVTQFITEDNAQGIPVDFAMEAQNGSLYLWEFLNFSGPQSLFRLTDLDGSGTIGAGEGVEVWNSTLLPQGITSFVGFGIGINDDGSVLLTSNARDAAGDNLFYLVDLNGDGDYLDPGETNVWLARSQHGTLPNRARNAIGYVPTQAPAPVPLPAGAPLILGALGALAALRTRRRQS